jgi:hypothetical protein
MQDSNQPTKTKCYAKITFQITNKLPHIRATCMRYDKRACLCGNAY